MNFENYKSKKVFSFFEQINQIPRGSGNEKELSDYIVNFAKERNLEYLQDEMYNLVIKKPATPGFENAPTLIIQGHLDMVCEKNSDTVHDFTKDPIKHVIKDDMLYADNTTLGADNGIAVAMAIAILDSTNIAHPCLEILFTVQEETGLVGATNLDPSWISGKHLINIDSEEEGYFMSSCAGGIRTAIELPITRTTLEGDYSCYELSIKGLKGGHSGMDINEGRGNSIKILGRLLYELDKELDLNIHSISGGSKNNAIPREAFASFSVTSSAKTLNDFATKWETTLKSELALKDDNITVSISQIDKKTEMFDTQTKNSALLILNIHPNGIESFSAHIPGLVESSLNLGVLSSDDDYILFDAALRSSVSSLKYQIVNKLEILANQFNAKFTTVSDYPSWSYDPNSKLRTLFADTYKDMYDKEAKIIALHAGLECGIFKEKFMDIDMISLGPDMYNVHTPDEHLNIPSVENVYTFLLEILNRSNTL